MFELEQKLRDLQTPIDDIVASQILDCFKDAEGADVVTMLADLSRWMRNPTPPAATEFLAVYSWDFIKIVISHLTADDETGTYPPTGMNVMIRHVLESLTNNGNAKEIQMFALEEMGRMTFEVNQLDQAEIYLELLSIWALALSRMRPKKLSIFLETAFPTLERGMQILPSTKRSMRRIAGFFLVTLNVLLEAGEESRKTSVENAEHSAQNAFFRRFVYSLSVNILGLCDDEDCTEIGSLLKDSADRIPLSYSTTYDDILMARSGDGQLSTTGASIFLSILLENAHPNDKATTYGGASGVEVFRPLEPIINQLLLQSEEETATVRSRGLVLLECCLSLLQVGDLTYTCTESDKSSCHNTIENLVTFMASTPDHMNRKRCFGDFKQLLNIVDENGRSGILIHLLTQSPVVSVQVAALAILKDNIHTHWDPKEKPSIFSGRLASNTFMAILLDLQSPVYRHIIDSRKSVLNDDELFLSKYPLLMHVANLLLYMLLRDKPEVNQTGLWDNFNIEKTQGFVRELMERTSRLRAEMQSDHQALQPDESSDEQELRQLMLDMELLESTLGRITTIMDKSA